MKKTLPIILVFLITLTSCGTRDVTSKKTSSVQVAGAMKNVMWKGELAGTLSLDTISNKEGLYALGPLEYLRGEILIFDGISYTSKVLTDTTMLVEENYSVKAPFLVYANQIDWTVENLPSSVQTIKELEEYINKKTLDYARPFVFKLKGQIDSAKIHIQNLPLGTKVRSPKEAHQGQTSYSLGSSAVDIVGFFSTEHKGVFTHHDTFVHLHLLTADRKQMGHLDEVRLGNMQLFLPKN